MAMYRTADGEILQIFIPLKLQSGAISPTMNTTPGATTMYKTLGQNLSGSMHFYISFSLLMILRNILYKNIEIF